jgi:hypothetical protein
MASRAIDRYGLLDDLLGLKAEQQDKGPREVRSRTKAATPPASAAGRSAADEWPTPQRLRHHDGHDDVERDCTHL